MHIIEACFYDFIEIINRNFIWISTKSRGSRTLLEKGLHRGMASFHMLLSHVATNLVSSYKTNWLSYNSGGKKSKVGLSKAKIDLLQGCVPSGGFRREPVLLIFPVPGGCLHSLAHDPCILWLIAGRVPMPSLWSWFFCLLLLVITLGPG